MPKLHFYKMHGAGNDFVLFDGRRVSLPQNMSALVTFLCDRRIGIGADGVMVLTEADCNDFRLRYYNADGSEGEMCGNGARCAAALANSLNLAPATMSFVIQDVEYAAAIEPAGRVRISMQPVVLLKPKNELSHLVRVGERAMLLEVGVPHLVVEIAGDLNAVDVDGVGRALRHHSEFAPRGCNVNFVQLSPSGKILIRTYERGVEEETRACGTGAVAAAFYFQQQGMELPLDVVPPGGDLQIREAESGCELVGPAEFVFEGTVEVPNELID